MSREADFYDFHKTSLGRIIHGDSLDVLAAHADKSVDLIMTSPPFGLGPVEIQDSQTVLFMIQASFWRRLE